MITKIMFGNVALFIDAKGVIDAKGPHLLYPCVVYINPTFQIVEELRRS